MQLVIIDKSGKPFARFVALLREQAEIRLPEIKKQIPRSRYYAAVVKKLAELNKLLRNIHPQLFLAEPSFSVTKSHDVYACVRRCDLIEIESKQYFFIIRWNNGKNPNNTVSRDKRATRTDSEQSAGQGIQDNIELPA